MHKIMFAESKYGDFQNRIFCGKRTYNKFHPSAFSLPLVLLETRIILFKQKQTDLNNLPKARSV